MAKKTRTCKSCGWEDCSCDSDLPARPTQKPKTEHFIAEWDDHEDFAIQLFGHGRYALKRFGERIDRSSSSPDDPV